MRAMLQQNLALAERHIAEGEIRITRQREMIAELERDGHDTTAAQGLLAVFQHTMALYVADRERLQNELGRC